MVLEGLGETISHALQQTNNTTEVNQQVFEQYLNEISHVYHQSIVHFKLADNIKRLFNRDDLASHEYKNNMIEQAVFNEMWKSLDSRRPHFTPEKGKPSVVMFVGLQGCGKTITCAKYAHYHQKKGFKPALVCADTFKTDGFDQLKQIATKASIPLYRSCMGSDHMKIAAEGVEAFKKENHDLVIVDTSGTHKQGTSHFEYIRQVSKAIRADLIIFVMDISIGQYAFRKAQAFMQSVSAGAVIFTKMDCHVNKSDTFKFVEATNSPILFFGIGKHIYEFKAFDVKSFVSHFLGIGEWSAFIDKIQEMVPMHQQAELLQKLVQRQFTLRDVYDLYQCFLKIQPINQVSSMHPGFSSEPMVKRHEKESLAKIKRYVTMMNSMTTEELNSSNPTIFDESHVLRIARGSGCTVTEVLEMMEMYKRMWIKKKDQNGRTRPLPRTINAQNIGALLPTQILTKIGGMRSVQNILKKFDSVRT